MSRIKFDGFTENYDVNKAILDAGGKRLVSNTLMQIVHRYKDADPAFRSAASINTLTFTKGLLTPGWRLNFNGELYTDSDTIADALVADTKNPDKNDGGFGLTQTFNYRGDTFQVYVNFREPIIG